MTNPPSHAFHTAQAHVADLDTLRHKVSPQQRALLDALWAEFRDRNRWIPRQALQAADGEAAFREACLALGDSVVRVCPDEGGESCQLTFLGVLLTEQGLAAEELMVRYLEYVRDRVRAVPVTEWVSSQEVEAALQLTPERSRLLRQLLRLSHWWGGGSAFGSREWTVGVPLDVEELPPGDLAAYLRDHVLAHFVAQAAGAAAGLRLVRAPAAEPPRSAFWFVRDAPLAQRLGADWHEAQDVCQVRGWKSCVLLCGGILEAVLRWALLNTGGAANPGPGLVPLANLASERGLLPEGLPLEPTLAAYPELLDPAASAGVPRQAAEGALETVRSCLRQLSAQTGGTAR